jgi:hypothetical protein
MSWLNGKSARQQALDIAENQDTLRAMREGLSKPGGSAKLREVISRHAADLEREIRAQRDQLVSEPLVYHRDCAFCVGQCKGH